jgi:hypothetical protein
MPTSNHLQVIFVGFPSSHLQGWLDPLVNKLSNDETSNSLCDLYVMCSDINLTFMIFPFEKICRDPRPFPSLPHSSDLPHQHWAAVTATASLTSVYCVKNLLEIQRNYGKSSLL